MTPTPSAPKTLEELKAEALRLVSAACGAWSNVVAHEGYTLAKANKAATAEADLRSAIEALAARGAQPLVQPGQVDEVVERVRFETYFATSRRSRGVGKKPSFDRLKEEPQAYADDHTQRHWWTWKNALATQADEAIDAAGDGDGDGAQHG